MNILIIARDRMYKKVGVGADDTWRAEYKVAMQGQRRNLPESHVPADADTLARRVMLHGVL